MSSVAEIKAAFSHMSAERDKPSNSTTEGRVTPLDNGGYVQEITSRSPVRRRPGTGEAVESVTTRRVVTTDGDDDGTSSIASSSNHPAVVKGSSGCLATGGLKYSSRHNNRDPSPINNQFGGSTQGLNATPPQELPGVGASSKVPTRYLADGTSPLPRPLPSNEPGYGTRSLVGSTSASPASTLTSSFRRTQRYGSAGSPNHVDFGKVDTQVVEPSRLSPMKVDTVYAPVRYITRKQLKRMQASRRSKEPESLGSKVRSSSVPRLDEYRRQSSRANAVALQRYAPPTSVASGGSHRSHDPDDDGDMGPESPQYYESDRSRNVAPRVFDPTAHGRHDAVRRGPIHTGGAGREPNGGFDVDDGMRGRSRSPIGSRRGSSAGASSRSTPTVRSIDAYTYNRYRPTREASPPRHIRETVSHYDENLTIDYVADILSALRNTTRDSVPAYSPEAFRLLHRGTYLVKYNAGQANHPHERFFTIRMMKAEGGSNRILPYLTWQMHAEACQLNDRIPLAWLIGVARGVDSEGFRGHLTGRDTLLGPFEGERRSKLPTSFAFTLVFQSTSVTRRVDLLALDDQTFRCWLLVCDYFALINTTSSGSGGAPMMMPPDVESLAPEARSPSVGSRR